MSHKEYIRISVLVEDVVNASCALERATANYKMANAKLSDYLKSLVTDDTKETDDDG